MVAGDVPPALQFPADQEMYLLEPIPLECFPCLECEQRFDTQTKLMHHVIIYHAHACSPKRRLSQQPASTILPPYECRKCPYKTRKTSSFKRHENIHFQTKVYCCGDCEYSSTQAGHVRRHRNSKHPMYTCSQYQIAPPVEILPIYFHFNP